MGRWLESPILARNSRGQCGQGMVPSFGVFSFFACLRSFADVRLWVSCCLAPLWIVCLHVCLSSAVFSQEVVFSPKALREDFRVSLNLFLGPPALLFPSVSSPKKSCLGRRWSGMRVTWPAQRSWFCISMVIMLGRPAFSSTSVSGTLSCHLMPRILRKHVVWK